MKPLEHGTAPRCSDPSSALAPSTLHPCFLSFHLPPTLPPLRGLTRIQLQECRPEEEAGRLQEDLPCWRWDHFPQQQPLSLRSPIRWENPSHMGLRGNNPSQPAWPAGLLTSSAVLELLHDKHKASRPARDAKPRFLPSKCQAAGTNPPRYP